MSSQYEIDFSHIPPATTPQEADQWFAARAQVVTNYNACRKQLDRELFNDELDFTTVAIAKLEKARQKAVRAKGFSSLKQFLVTHGLDPSQGVREFIRNCWPGVSSVRMLFERDGERCSRCSGQDTDHITQVNEALLRSQVRSKVGTSSDIPLCKRTGEWDFALRGLITIMYRYRQFLRPDVYDHVLHHLLNQSGPHNPSIESWRCDVISWLDIPQLDIPETENHILLIETSRYLTNQLLLEEARNNGRDAPEFDNEKNGMNEWMLRKLQSFLMNDFQEYNGRPYQIYSLMAIQNLYDFADDHDPTNPGINRVRLAAQMVLDYLSATFAVSSNGLRRAVPFRRRKEHKDETLLFDHNSDSQTLRFLLLSGLTQRLAEVQPPSHASYGARDIMQLAAVGKYRVPEMILDLVMNKAHKSYYQRLRHAGVELYASSPAFLISGGGIWMESVHEHDEFFGYADAGWALPTTLMPTEGGVDRADFIRINGAPEDRNRVNTGVAPGFACGLNPYIPPSYFISLDTVHIEGGSAPTPCSSRHGPWTFIDASGRCNSARKFGFYVAVYSSPCTTEACVRNAGSGGSFGFFEATSSENLDFNAFQRMVLERNESRTYTSEGINEYVTVTGRTIRFIPNPSGNKYRWGIVSDGSLRDFLTTRGFDPSRGVREFMREFRPGVSSLRTLLESADDSPDLAPWPLVAGDIINSDGHSGSVNDER